MEEPLKALTLKIEQSFPFKISLNDGNVLQPLEITKWYFGFTRGMAIVAINLCIDRGSQI